MTKKCRIVKVTRVDGSEYYQIQRRIWFFGWKYIDADWFRISGPTSNTKEDGDLELMRKRLCYFDGTKEKIEVIE